MLTITSDNLGDVTVLRCGGRIAFGYADRLLTAISKQPWCRIVVLDLADVIDIDAAGIGTLVSVRELAKVRGVALKLMNLTPRVEDLLELTHLRLAFEICSVVEMLNLLCRAFERSELVNCGDSARSCPTVSGITSGSSTIHHPLDGSAPDALR